MRFTPSIIAAALCSQFIATATAEEPVSAINAIERITVQGDFRQQSVQNLAGSVAVVAEQDVKRTSAQHLDDVLNQFANVNFTAGASRGRFIQVRGIGERSEFVDTINPSVGILIDGIEYSGLGISGISDLAQLEVFRGPEATRFGANALAGMVNLTTKGPTATAEGKFSATLADYDSYQLAGQFSDSINQQLGYSLALEQQSSDGFIENAHLNRDDTNDIDEFTGRFKLRYQPFNDLSLQLIMHLVDQNNGYDAFSPDGYSMAAAFTAEFVLTMFFLIVILGATDKAANGKFAGVAIGLALTLIHLISIPITNTSVNPARSTSQAIFAQGESLSQLWLFWVAPIAGALVGGFIYKILLEKKDTL